MNREQMVVNAIRVLSAEAVQKAKSGHPGMPMGSAAMAYAVWGKQMKHNPADPKWRNRDRFVPLPTATHQLLRRFWATHRNPALLFPNRHRGLAGAASATTPLDPGGVQNTLHKVITACGLKKRSRRTACATPTPRTSSRPAWICCRCKRSWATTAS